MQILLPVLTLGVIGIAFGLLLTFASKKFYVEVDEKVAAIRAALPGANCGACGFAGCDAYAAAVAAGTAPVNACKPAGPDGAAAIGAIMGVTVAASAPYMAYPMCNGTIGNTKEVFDYDGVQSCSAAAIYAGGQKSCRFACLGFGDCQKACSFDALQMVDAEPIVDAQKCTGCGACQDACPKKVIAVIPEGLPVVLGCRNTDLGKRVKEVCARGCISCQKCKKACEVGAIEMQGNLPQIDYAKCIKCGKCADACPTKCLSKIDRYCVPSPRPSDAV